jgi:hypothetical protein
VQGPAGQAGPDWLNQPGPVELVRNLVRATTHVTPRTLIDPRAGYRYAATVTSQLVDLQRGLVLRALIPTNGATPADSAEDMSNVRFIA